MYYAANSPYNQGLRFVLELIVNSPRKVLSSRPIAPAISPYRRGFKNCMPVASAVLPDEIRLLNKYREIHTDAMVEACGVDRTLTLNIR